MTKLSVNVNKLATIRNARGKNNPDVLKAALDIVAFGADGITVHPRPDGRHIRREDVFNIAKQIQTEFNIEGYPDPQFLALIKEIRPTQCTLVPDPPHVLTSNAGWKIEKNLAFLKDVVDELHSYGVRTSLFVDPNDLAPADIAGLKTIGTDRVELYTESYADAFDTPAMTTVLKKYQDAANQLNQLGIGLNAGHDLNLFNLRTFIEAIPTIEEVSIGHALICDALYLGLEATVRAYLTCLK